MENVKLVNQICFTPYLKMKEMVHPVRDKQSIHYILGKRVEVQIWDTCEDPRFQSLLTIVYNCANGLFLCFDITNKQSFLALDNEVISAMEFEKSRPKK